MPTTTTREQIIAAADRLIYERGYEFTSFAAIADAVRISRGNFYHHFPAKDSILAAVIARRLSKTKSMLEQWTRDGATADARIGRFIDMLEANRTQIASFGCPVGSLCTELAKLNHAATRDAAALFTLFRDWLRQHFIELGCGEKADALAMRLLAQSQGVATLASAFRDEAYLQREAAELRGWLRQIAASAAA